MDLLGFHERAVRTPSHDGVDAMRGLLCDTLRDEGFEPRVDDAGNTLASRGDGRPHVVLNTHVDTVPPHVPFARDGDRIEGRGACDAKGPLAALLDAFVGTDPAGTLTLAVTPDEETTSAGAAHLAFDDDPLSSHDGPVDSYVVGEPTGLDVCIAAKGRFEGTVTVRGEHAHAAEPAAGENAVAHLEAVLRALRTFDGEHGPGTHPALGAPTLQPTVVRGGDAVNQLPDEATVTVDRRSVPPETAEGFERDLNDHLAREAGSEAVPEGGGACDVSFALTARETPFLEAFATDEDAAVVRALRAAGAGDPRPFSAATEASYFAGDAPTVVFGPGVLADDDGAVAHGPREYVLRRDVERAARILRGGLAALFAAESV